MIKTNYPVIPYIDTMGTKKYFELVNKKFDINYFYPFDKSKSIKVLFKGWKGMKSMDYFKLKNDKIILEFYYDTYKINDEITLPIPNTLNDLINDLNRFNVTLYWSDWIDEEFEPIDFIKKDEIKKYYVDLLNVMEKDYELL